MGIENCRESGYEWRMIRVIRKLRDDWDMNEDGDDQFTDWLWANPKVFGEYMLGDLSDWMGVADAVTAAKGDSR